MAGQVVANLVHNALAHGDAGGHVGIVLEATHETFALMVIDDGPGVAPRSSRVLVNGHFAAMTLDSEIRAEAGWAWRLWVKYAAERISI